MSYLLIECPECKGTRVISKRGIWKCMECRHEWELSKMPTKHIMTRAEAIAKFHEARTGYHSAEKIIDFYIAAGMLEIKEEEKDDLAEWLVLKYVDGWTRKIATLEIAKALDAVGYYIKKKD